MTNACLRPEELNEHGGVRRGRRSVRSLRRGCPGRAVEMGTSWVLQPGFVSRRAPRPGRSVGAGEGAGDSGVVEGTPTML